MNYNDFQMGTTAHDRELSIASAFPILMRKVYVWMALALVLTGVTAYGVATSPGLITAIATNLNNLISVLVLGYVLLW